MTTKTADDGRELSPLDRAAPIPDPGPDSERPSAEPTHRRLRRLDQARLRLCERASGDVLDIGVGEGRNLRHYAGGVRLTGIDLNSAMIEATRAEAQRLGRTVTLIQCDAHVLPFPAESFDCVVAFRVLCAVADDAIVLREAMRILRSGGSLLLTDHVVSSWPVVRDVQRAMDRLIAPSTGEFRARRPIVEVRGLGFEIVEARRGRFGLTEYVHARKPANSGGAYDAHHTSSERMRLRSEEPPAAEPGSW
jgi:SAM-dependent methyltransferase